MGGAGWWWGGAHDVAAGGQPPLLRLRDALIRVLPFAHPVRRPDPLRAGHRGDQHVRLLPWPRPHRKPPCPEPVQRTPDLREVSELRGQRQELVLLARLHALHVRLFGGGPMVAPELLAPNCQHLFLHEAPQHEVAMLLKVRDLLGRELAVRRHYAPGGHLGGLTPPRPTRDHQASGAPSGPESTNRDHPRCAGAH